MYNKNIYIEVDYNNFIKILSKVKTFQGWTLTWRAFPIRQIFNPGIRFRVEITRELLPSVPCAKPANETDVPPGVARIEEGAIIPVDIRNGLYTQSTIV